jgi:hypothetical protein
MALAALPQPPKGTRGSAHEKREAKLIGELAGMHRGLIGGGAYAHHPPAGKKAHSRRRK